MAEASADFHQKVVDLVDEHHIQLEEIASKVGVSYISVYRWYKGTSRPKQKIIQNSLEGYFDRVKNDTKG